LLFVSIVHIRDQPKIIWASAGLLY